MREDVHLSVLVVEGGAGRGSSMDGRERWWKVVEIKIKPHPNFRPTHL